MGYKRKRKVYKLDFEGTEYDGLEVRVSGLTTGEYLDLVSLSAPGTEGGKETDGMLQLFSEHLLSWNLIDDETDEPVPTTFDGIKSNDLRMNMAIVNAWTDAMVEVSAKTEKKSVTGDDPLVASIPMETL
jgi:hypothetical protein